MAKVKVAKSEWLNWKRATTREPRKDDQAIAGSVVQVVPTRSRKHKSEVHVIAREIHESYCADPACRFFGKKAVQGVCHTTEPFADGTIWDYVVKVDKAARSYLEMRQVCLGKSAKDYVRRLESEIVCHWSNNIHSIDELVRLRMENAILRDDLEKLRAKKARR